VFEVHRSAALGANLIGVQGHLQREGQVIHVVDDTINDESWRLARLDTSGSGASLNLTSKDFH